MYSFEPGTLPPQPSHHGLPYPPMMMMMGPSQMYPHSFNPTSSQPAMMNPIPNPNPAMMQSPFVSFNHLNPPPSLLHPNLPRGPTSQNEPFVYGGSTSRNVRVGIPVQPVKRGRGRPRKNPSDNNNNNNAGTSMLSDASPAAPSDSPVVKRGRGRPPGSVKKPRSGSSGIWPHLLIVQEGEDIIAKLRAFSQEVSQTVSVMNISGAVCNVTIVQPPLSGHTVTYNGPLEILPLSIIFSPPGSNLGLNETTVIAVQDREGHFLGGEVSGELIAANTIQILLVSIIIEAAEISPVPSNNVGTPPVADVSPASGCLSSPVSQENVNYNLFSNLGIENEVYDMGRYSNMQW